MSNYIIPQSLEYYDKINIANKDIIDKINYCIFDNKKKYIKLYDKNLELVKDSKYEILGVYNSANKLWTWAWSISVLSKELTTTAKKIFNYGFDLDVEYMVLKNELINSRFKISNDIQLDILVSLATYLSKKDFVFSYKKYNDEIYLKDLVIKNDKDDKDNSDKDNSDNDSKYINVKKTYENEEYDEIYLILL
jgi:hypothetical protein